MTQTDPPYEPGETFHDQQSDLEWQVAEVRREYRMVIRPAGGADGESEVEESYFPETVLEGKLDRGELEAGPAPPETVTEDDMEDSEGNGSGEESESPETNQSSTGGNTEADSDDGSGGSDEDSEDDDTED
jgi:hypothetical protein